MRSDQAWTSVTVRAQLGLELQFLSFQTKSLCLAPSRGSDSGQSISKECKNWMWAICWKVVLINVSQWPSHIIVTEWDPKFGISLIRGVKQGQNLEGLVIFGILWHTHELNLHKALWRHSLALAVGAGRRSCCTIRLDSELMGLPHRPGPVLYLPTYIVSVWKRPPKASSLSPHMSWSWRISGDKVAQSHCWVCWGLSMPGPVLCHQKSLLKIYGYYLPPLCGCVCIQIGGKYCYTI